MLVLPLDQRTNGIHVRRTGGKPPDAWKELLDVFLRRSGVDAPEGLADADPESAVLPESRPSVGRLTLTTFRLR